jgi:hypothetical protein
LYFNNDLRLTAPDKELAWRVSSRVTKICSWLGLQDAARKRIEPSQTPGAWAGAVVSTENGVVTKYITQERWEKSQNRLKWLGFYAGCELKEEEVDFSLEKELKIGKPPPGKLSHKIAEKYRGFLVYVSRTYRAMVPYLKGLHLTLDFWRADRDEDGWRVRNTVDPRLDAPSGREKPPKYVPMAPRFAGDMKVLLDFFKGDTPPRIPVRPTETAAVYMVGEASGTGFGTTTWKHGSEKIGATHGAWEESVRKKSSNFREAYNLVLGIEKMAKQGELKPGTELFVFTDNSTSERAFDSGTSKFGQEKGLRC